VPSLGVVEIARLSTAKPGSQESPEGFDVASFVSPHEPSRRVFCSIEESTVEIFVFARLHARPGRQRNVQQAMLEVGEPTRNEPGCLSHGAFQSVRDPDEFYIHSRWQNLASFDHHAKLPHTVRFIDCLGPLLDHPFKATLSEQLCEEGIGTAS
jgi:quinol monooxygenase YgiN